MSDDNESEEEKIGFGDKFTRNIIGSIAGFFMTLVAEYLYTRWFIEKNKDSGEDKHED